MKTSYVLAAAILAGTGTGNAQTPTVDCPATTLMPGCAVSLANMSLGALSW
jgi:hypothetical protein